ncbi:hypothetical protein JCM10049v2_000588 [Rhodotorula toruloides]
MRLRHATRDRFISFEPEMGDESGPHLSIAAGITVGLVSSFVQSLGLTVQRLSHLSNEKLPADERKRDWQRPLWLSGFAVFIVSNVFGTLFQLGALPIVVLGPLGAVSLLWNAFFARIILGDHFSAQLVAGSLLIAGGATLIGIFGVVPEPTLSLPRLIALYTRPAFLLFLLFLALGLLFTLSVAHLAEWRLNKRLENLHPPPGTPKTPRAVSRAVRKRRWSVPPLGAAKSTPQLASGERQPLLPKHAAQATAVSPERATKPRPPSLRFDDPKLGLISLEETMQRIERTRVWLATAYGATSGTLAGLCLLFTKTGVDLVILTIQGKNQFNRIEAWLILAMLLICELLQLAYLNRALRLSGPTFVCPLSFCFYNTASIVSGIIYYRQADALSRLQGGMVGLGCTVLLAGVWVVSLRSGASKGEEKVDTGEGWTDEPEDLAMEGVEDLTDQEEPVTWRPRGFSIGLSAASPGFEIRPRPGRAHTAALPTSSPFSTSSEDPLARSTASLLPNMPRRTRPARGHRRSESLSGALYVGEADEDIWRSAVAAEAPTGDGLGIQGAATERSGAETARTREKWVARRLAPGDGSLTVSLDNRSDAHFSSIQFSYPLKLIVPKRRFLPGVQCVYVLSYGGGLVAGDRVRLKGEVEKGATLIMLTQGSTKVFKLRPGRYLHAPHLSESSTTEQLFRLSIAPSATLVLLPAPVTCFSRARYSQRQVVHLLDRTSSLVLLDWYTSGRMGMGNGEEWEFDKYRSENEIWLEGRRIAKDVMLLEDEIERDVGEGIDNTDAARLPTTYRSRVAPYACYATLFLFGPAVAPLLAHLSTSFAAISQYKQSLPYSLVWSFSQLPGHPEGAGIARCAGASTEEVKEWVVHMLEEGGIEKLMGRDLWRTAFN